MAKQLGIGICLVAMCSLTGCAAPEDEEEDEPDVDEVGTATFELSEVTGFGTNPGNLRMFKHVPTGLPTGGRPLVVVLHGCTQTAADTEKQGWTAIANDEKFLLVFAQQQSSNNGLSCFNWFLSGDKNRGVGEALSIKQMVDRMKSDHSIDGGKVFVAGFSAGACMAANLMCDYPDVFRGAGIFSGVPGHAAATQTEGTTQMNPGVNRTPDEWGNRCRNASPYPGSLSGIKVAVYHGSSDGTVNQMNATEIDEQFGNVGAVSMKHIVTGMGHAVANNPSAGCGSVWSYTYSSSICSVRDTAAHWGIAEAGDGGGGGGDPTCSACRDSSCCQMHGCSGWSSFYNHCYSGIVSTRCSCF